MTKNNMMTVVVPKATSSSNVGEQCQHKSSATLTTNDVKDIKEGQSVVDEILSKIKPSSFGQKRLYSSINISADKWLLTLDENSIAKLENPPSLADGVDRKTELDLRYLGCEIIQSGAILLRIPQVAAATAQILYQRFYYQRSFVRHHFEYTVMACLLLASKIEEAPRRPRDVINVFHRLEHLHGKRNESKKYVPMLLDRNYVDLKNQIIKAERKLLNALGFVVHVNHPHKLIYAYLHALGATGNHELMQKAWSYMNDGLRTDIFLRYRPETIACACIHLAARTIAEPIPLPREPFPWFEAFDASDRDVQTISLLLLQVYTRIRAPNWTRLNDMLNKLRIGLSNSFAKAQHGESLAHKEVERAKAVLEKKRREIASKTAELERRQNGAGQSLTKEVIAKEKEVHRIREKENDRYNVKQSSSSLSRSRSKSPTVPKKFRSSPSYHHRSGSLERERPQKPNHHRSRQRDERRRAREERRAEKERRHRTRSRGDRRKDKVSSQREREKDVYMALGKRRRSNESPSPAKVRR